MERGAQPGVGVRRLRNVAREEPFAAVLGALRGCYAEATPLEAFVRRLQEGGTGEVEVLRGDDAQCYRTFVSQCVVCVPRGARAIPRPICFQQLSSQSEVITRIVQRLCEKKKKNILAYGYSLLDENSCHFRVLPSSCIYSYLSNTVTETIRISGLWEILLSRIGDDVMMYLLEHCALFMLVPPSNCYQVCGQPIYELISRNIGPSPGFVRRRYSRFKHNSLLDYVRKRLVFHRHYLSKSQWWKCRPRRRGRVSSRRKRRSHRIQSLRSGYQPSAKVNFQAGNHSVPAYEHCYREEILAKFLYWLMDSYVIELLKSFFYITETMFQKNMLFYYRKFIWGKLQNIGIRDHFAKVHLRALSSEEMEVIRQKKYFPIASRLRFIPKMNGLRPVVRLSRVVEGQKLSKESREKKIQRYNTQLKNLFSVLNYERTVNTSIIGSSVFGRDDIYRKWKEFVTKVFESGGEMPHFYFVKGDVSRAFDTIPHKKLVEVISQVLKPESQTVYGIRWYAVIMITPTGKARKLYKRHVSTFEDFIPDMKQFVSKLQERTSLRNAIVVEQRFLLNCYSLILQCLTFNENSSTLFTFFLQMLHNNILEIGHRYYIQCSGIPQGSILSTLLCSLCYGDMENKLLCGIQKDGVLIRLIDDFLLVTPHLMQARTFLRTIAAGIPEYGFLINAKKTVVNFPVDDIPGCSKFKHLPDCRLISWCGLLLDVQTLEVYCDYSSYAFTSIRSSLSFNSSRIAGKNMKCKLTAVLKLKCHPLLLDLKINSLQAVLINIYKIFLLQAYRFHACVLQLPFNQKVRNNPDFFLRIISDTASCCYFILKAKNPGVSLGSKDASGMFPFEAAEWLCYHAFIVKLSNHKVIYKCLLKPLKVYKMHLFGKIPRDTMELLKTVTEPSLCQDFKTILD
ncbi:telomerase reverse transcriptase isoform X4 [Gallus gallus]|uniref:telomerase reverse transcriptase isoform X4 n=1 Tax=Gallus gallus TaxID=9031 RepID=UPI001F015AB6|nr:telomerase reverse transcriptase isoform X4 [Gallus gallus]